MSQFRLYFSIAQAKSASGAVYVDNFVQYSIPIDNFKGDAETAISGKITVMELALSEMNLMLNG